MASSSSVPTPAKGSKSKTADPREMKDLESLESDDLFASLDSELSSDAPKKKKKKQKKKKHKKKDKKDAKRPKKSAGVSKAAPGNKRKFKPNRS